jgi:hypothetical protein
MPVTHTFLVVEKTGSLKEVSVKQINKDEIYKKCGFRKPEGFEMRTAWENIKVGNNSHSVQLWARDEGKAGSENKYEFPPPVDTALYFGNCALVQVNKDNHETFISLSKDLWLKIYEVLFGGFETIGDENDDDEPDELATIKKEMKTKKTGYLKDGFVVDSDEEEPAAISDDDSDEDSDGDEDDSDDSESSEGDDVECSDVKSDIMENNSDDITGGSELEEEAYEYSDDDV